MITRLGGDVVEWLLCSKFLNEEEKKEKKRAKCQHVARIQRNFNLKKFRIRKFFGVRVFAHHYFDYGH